MTNQKIPKGIDNSSMVLLISAGLASLWAFIALISGPPDTQFYQSLIRITSIISPFLFLIPGIGLRKLKNWARLLSIGFLPVVGVFFVYGAYQVFAELSVHPEWAFDNILFGLILLSVAMTFLWIAFYLTRSQVKSRFK